MHALSASQQFTMHVFTCAKCNTRYTGYIIIMTLLTFRSQYWNILVTSCFIKNVQVFMINISVGIFSHFCSLFICMTMTDIEDMIVNSNAATKQHCPCLLLLNSRLKSHKIKITLGVVGVVRVLVADAHNTSRGPKCQILTKNPPFSFFQYKVGCPPYPYKKFERKSYL